MYNTQLPRTADDIVKYAQLLDKYTDKKNPSSTLNLLWLVCSQWRLYLLLLDSMPAARHTRALPATPCTQPATPCTQPPCTQPPCTRPAPLRTLSPVHTLPGTAAAHTHIPQTRPVHVRPSQHAYFCIHKSLQLMKGAYCAALLASSADDLRQQHRSAPYCRSSYPEACAHSTSPPLHQCPTHCCSEVRAFS